MIYFCNVRKTNFTWGLRRVINGDGGGGGRSYIGGLTAYVYKHSCLANEAVVTIIQLHELYT